MQTSIDNYEISNNTTVTSLYYVHSEVSVRSALLRLIMRDADGH